MPATKQHEGNVPPPGYEHQPGPANSTTWSGASVPPALTEPEVIDGEIIRIDPPEQEPGSSDGGQQVSYSEITIALPPDQEPPAPRQCKPYYLLVIVTIALGVAALLVGLLVPLLTPTAIVTITPMSRDLSITATFSLQGRVLGPLTLVQSSGNPATGHRHQNAQQARGTITFFNGLLTAQTIAAGTILTGSDDVQVVTDAAAIIPVGNPPVYGEVTVAAHALLAGPRGNIRTGDIHTACCATAVVAENSVAFIGGQNARNYTVVAQQDIAAASSALQTSLKKAAQAGLAVQTRSDEAVLTPPCHTTTQADHEPGEEATVVQVTVTATCHGLAYAKGALEGSAQWALTQESVQQLGPGYGVLGTIQVSVIQATFTDQGQGMATVQVQAAATYAYQITPGEEAYLKHLIAGASDRQAITRLLHLPGIQGATVNAATLPADPNHIQIVIVYEEG